MLTGRFIQMGGERYWVDYISVQPGNPRKESRLLETDRQVAVFLNKFGRIFPESAIEPEWRGQEPRRVAVPPLLYLDGPEAEDPTEYPAFHMAEVWGYKVGPGGRLEVAPFEVKAADEPQKQTMNVL